MNVIQRAVFDQLWDEEGSWVYGFYGLRFWTLTLSANPVLDLQTRYALKFPFVVGHYGKAFRLGVRGDPQIIVSDRPPFGLQ